MKEKSQFGDGKFHHIPQFCIAIKKIAVIVVTVGGFHFSFKCEGRGGCGTGYRVDTQARRSQELGQQPEELACVDYIPYAL